MIRMGLVAWVILAVWAGSGSAQSGDPAALDSPTSGVETGASVDRVEEIRQRYTPENQRYASIRTVLRFLFPLYSALVALLLLVTGWSARMRDFAYRRVKGRYGRVLIYIGLFAVAVFVLELPLVWYSGYWLEHQFDLSNQTLAAWFGEQGIDLGVSIALFGLTGLIALAYLAVERSPKHWWWQIGLGAVPVTLFMVLIHPVFIAPLYNKFEPLENRALETKIVALAAKAGIPGRRVYQVDRSKQTKKFNAYVTGFGASQRIVLWDTIIEGMREDELLFVMGHEMGHYKLAHLWKGILLYCLMGFVLLFLCARLANGLMRRFGERWGFTELHDVASMPLFTLTLGLLLFVLSPIMVGYSRTVEHEADVFALEVTRTNDAGARAFIQLGSQNRSNPEPAALVKFWHYTHPPLIERVQFALDYRPWEEGKPNRAFKPEPQ